MSRARQFLFILVMTFCNCYAGVVFAVSKPIALDSIVGEVNDAVITQSQLDYEINNARRAGLPAQSLRTLVLEQLINQKLQLQLARANDLQVDTNTLNQALAHIAQEHGISLGQLPNALAQQGIDFTTFRNKITEQLLIQQLQQHEVAPLVKISEQEVTQLAHQLAKQPRLTAADATTYQVQDILVERNANASAEQQKVLKQTANQLVSQLKVNSDSEQLVSAADSPAAHVKINDLGKRKLSELPELFAKALATLPAGAITGPLQAPNGWHILKVLAVQGAAAPLPGKITETHARHILIKPNVFNNAQTVKARLAEIRNKVVHGVDFAQLAEANSEDPGSADRGGDLGWVKPGMLDPSFESVMNKLQLNEVSQPFASQFGWHLIQVLGRRQIDDTSTQLHEQARQLIFQRKFAQALSNWLKQLRAQAYIKIVN